MWRIGKLHFAQLMGIVGMEQIIYLEPGDDITSIRDRLEWARARRVLLVVPPKCRALTSEVNLKLLHRQARDLSMELALVTRNKATKKLAAGLDLPVFSSVQRGQREGWYAGEEEVSSQRAKLERVHRQRVASMPSRAQSPLVQQVFAFGLFSALVALLIAGALLVVPEARVTLIPATQEVSEAILVRASPDALVTDQEAALIPARVVELVIEGEAHSPTISRRDAPDAHATGTVVFSNKTSQEVVVPMGVSVRTSTGTNIRFTTTETATLESRGRAEVGIEAVEPGPSGNVDPFTINVVEGSWALQVAVINDKPTAGGNVAQVGVVTQVDKDRLKAMLLQQLQQEAYLRLQDELNEQEFIPPETLTIDVLAETYDKFVGEQADVLGLKMRVAARGTAVPQQEANALVHALLQARVREGYELLPQGLEFRVGDVVNVEGSSVSFIMRASGYLTAKIDPGVVKENIRGKPTSLARSYLRESLPLRAEPVVEVNPDWLGRVPFFPFRIRVSIEPGVG